MELALVLVGAFLSVLLAAVAGLVGWNLRMTVDIRVMIENFSGRLAAVEEKVNQRKTRK